MSRTIATLLTLSIIHLLTPGSAGADDARARQAAIIHSVFDRLTAAVGDERRAPPRLVIEAIGEAAFYSPAQPTIHVDAELFDLCRTLGPDSINALAVVIGHELAHYYLGHQLFDGVLRKDDRKRLNAVLKWETSRETEADFYGGVYRHLAGYDSYIAPTLLQKIYERYGYLDGYGGHLNWDRRKEIATTINDSLRRLIPVFDAANNLTLARLYGPARSCYDYLIARFPSREMFNNAGAAYALQALTIIGGEGASFTYPFELDEDTRLSDVKINRGYRAGRTRSPSPGDSLLARQLLDSARVRFRAAAARDSGYGPALVNLAATEALLGRFGVAIKVAARVAERDTSRRTRLLALVVRAIAEARMGRRAAARERLNGIAGTADSIIAGPLARANLAAIDSDSFAIPSGGDRLSTEFVEGYRTDDTAATTYRSTTQEFVGGDSALWVLARELDYSSVIRVQTRTTWIQFLGTGSGYPQRSGRGIVPGSSVDSLLGLYGRSPRIVEAPQGRYYVYDLSKIIFLLGDDGKVVRWVAYAIGTLAMPEPVIPRSRAPLGTAPHAPQAN